MEFTVEKFGEPTRAFEVPVAQLVTSGHAGDFAPAATSSTEVLQPFGSERQNGRLGAPLSACDGDPWIVTSSSPLRDGTTPRFVLHTESAVLVQASSWQLFGRDGRPRGGGLSGSSPIVLSARANALRLVHPDGCLLSSSLESGRPAWVLGLHHADNARYPFVAIQGDKTVVVGGEVNVNPEADPRPLTVAIEVFDITEPVDVTPGGFLRSARTPGALLTPYKGRLVAALGDHLIVAWLDHVCAIGLDLSVRWAVTERFEPRSLSLGDDGRAYLVVRTPEGARLWMLNANGGLVFSSPLPDEALSSAVPPIVAPDHRVFVVTPRQVLAFNPMGEPRWSFTPPDGRPHAAVTADGWLLVALGDSVGLLDSEGRGLRLFNLPGEALCTAPTLTAQGEVLVASERALFCVRGSASNLDAGQTLVR